MVANSNGLQALLDQFTPRTRDIVRQTPIASDLERLTFLLTLVPQHQSDVARRLNMGWEWNDALKLLPEPPPAEDNGRADGPDELGAHPAELTAVATVPEPAETDVVLGEDAEVGDLEARPGPFDFPSPVLRVRVNELRANPINAKIFSESLTDARLRDLADHLARYGQREPIIVDSSLMILSGERRWRALRLIGAEYAHVILDPTQRSADELEDLVLDDFSLKRKPSLEEQLNAYEAYVRSFTRRYGRARGRPNKADKLLSGFWKPNRVRDEAAAAAGLGSRETARQALWVMKHADSGTRAAMLSRDMTIHAAYSLLHEAGEDEAGSTGIEPSPQLPSGSSVHSSAPAPQPSDIEGSQQRATTPFETVAPSSGEPPSSGSTPSASPGDPRWPSPPHDDGGNPGVGEASTSQSAGADGARHKLVGEGDPGLNGHPPEHESATHTKPTRAKERDPIPDRRSFHRGLKAAVGYVAALRDGDKADKALRARNDAMALFDAAAFGHGRAELQPLGADGGEDDLAGEDSVLNEGGEGSEDDPALDDAEEDLTVSEVDDEDSSIGSEHADGGQEDAELDEAEAEDEDDLGKAKDEEFDYSDYYDDDDADENGDRQGDADDDDPADSADEDESEQQNELDDPEDAEIDRIIGRSRARRI